MYIIVLIDLSIYSYVIYISNRGDYKFLRKEKVKKCKSAIDD